MNAIWDKLNTACFGHAQTRERPPAGQVEEAVGRALDAFTTRDAIEATEWLIDAAVLLQRCPASVRDVLPAHADNLTVMTAALSDMSGDVIGHYSKREGI